METTASMNYVKTPSRSEKINVPFLAFWASYLALVSMFLGYVITGSWTVEWLKPAAHQGDYYR